MKVTTKGQVTIPQHIREKLGILPDTEVEFVEEKERVYIQKSKNTSGRSKKFQHLRGIATVKMTKEEILALTR